MSFDVNRPDAILRLMVVRSVRVHMAAILLSLLPIPAATVHAREAALGEQLPAMTLRGLNGPALSLASLRGRPLLINVWASWCEPCREEMTSLERLAWRNGGRDFAIIGISTDDDAQQALTLLRNTHATISHFIDVRQQMEALLGASGIPVTVLVDGRGRVLARIYGAQQWDSPSALQLLHDTFIPHKPRKAGPPVLP
jgi:thiol-disulfide isomerase/thioredoxin